MNASKARALLRQAEAEPNRFKRHLLVAASLREALSDEPIVVGGLAQDYYTAPIYHETDLDCCAFLRPEDRHALSELGFVREGRHWFHEPSRVAVEFPDDRIDGDEERTITEAVGTGAARIIGLEDLYLDRVRQATATSSKNDVSFKGALAVAAARYEDVDWNYVRRRIADVTASEPMIGREMSRINRSVRSKARRAFSDPDP